MRGYLLDTSILIWLLRGEPLPKAVKSVLEQPTGLIYVSTITIAEICIKNAIGKLDLPDEVVDAPITAFEQAIEDAGLTQLPLKLEHSAQLMHLPLHHKDPFDRLLISQAIVEQLVMVSTDGQFSRYPGLSLLRF